MKKLLSILVCVALISSCGVITKTRYGNGVKVDIGNGLFAKREKTEELKAEKAVKVGNVAKEEPIVVSNSVVKNAELLKEDTGYATPQVFKGNMVSNTYHKAVQKIKNNGVKLPTKSAYNEYPVERNAKWAGILFYGGMFIPFINGVLVIIGFILAIVALGKIKQSGGLLRGKGLAISIIVVFGLSVLFTMFLYILLFALFL